MNDNNISNLWKSIISGVKIEYKPVTEVLESVREKANEVLGSIKIPTIKK